MLFTSWEFVIFLSIVLLLYYSLPTKGQNIMLLVVSYIFYGWWDYRFLSLLFISTIVDYFTALQMQKTEDPIRRRYFLYITLISNLGMLGFFKYFNFFADSFAVLLQSFGLNPSIHTLNIILPVGISFYTFQTLAYTVDVYRKKQEADPDFLNFALYVTYFPQLVAGPIERSQNLLPIFRSKRIVTRQQISEGIQLVLMGLIKKIAIADAVAPEVNNIFANPQAFSSGELLLGTYLFALQIYGDFSGYTDIARGVSKFMGIELMLNFEQPYLSQNIQEFWRRWHISLSTWLRDYLYIPLGGNKKGTFNTYRNLFITMFLGGLWHGASWTFVAWGSLHGIYLAVHRYFSKSNLPTEPSQGHLIPKLIKIVLTFNLVSLTWIFFRAPDFKIAFDYFVGIFNPFNFGPVHESLVVFTGFYILLVLAVDLPLYLSRGDLLLTNRTSWIYRSVVYASMILILSFLGENNAQPFIYFQF